MVEKAGCRWFGRTCVQVTLPRCAFHHQPDLARNTPERLVVSSSPAAMQSLRLTALLLRASSICQFHDELALALPCVALWSQGLHNPVAELSLRAARLRPTPSASTPGVGVGRTTCAAIAALPRSLSGIQKRRRWARGAIPFIQLACRRVVVGTRYNTPVLECSSSRG